MPVGGREPSSYNDSSMLADQLDPHLDSPDLKRKKFSIVGILKKYSRFIGPGLMVSVAYMDPGNYSTSVAAGSAYRYNLLFAILLSNCLAIFLQILSAKLGAVTGLDLAACCRANLPRKYNLIMYALAELAIVATDLAEVVGTAIALNILFKLPLLLGVIVTVVDVLIVLMAYRPEGPFLFIRIFEGFVSILVAGTVVCFAIELYQVSSDESINFKIGEVLLGYLPNEKVIDLSDREGGNGLFLSLAILGATVMPHSLFLGSGVVQSRLKEFDIKHGYFNPLSLQNVQETNKATDDEEGEALINNSNNNEEDEEQNNSPSIPDELSVNLEDYYRPSIHAINDTMAYTIVELVISLFTVALFVNSAILIIAGATVGETDTKRDDDGHESDTDSDVEDNKPNYSNADLFTIYDLLSKHISATAGFVFALALLFSGQSAGVVCTLAGQMVLEGFLLWSLPPVARRLITRGIAIVPCLVVVSTTGREGLANILNASQVLLSILLPIVSAPLIWFTCSKQIMRVPLFVRDGDEEADLIYDIDDSSSIHLVNTATNGTNRPIRFKSTEPAIRLQDLRKSHPCAGWEEDEDLDNQQQGRPAAVNESGVVYPEEERVDFLNATNSASTTLIGNDTLDNGYRVKGYKDMSNGPITAFFAVFVWGFITCLNLFLIGSMLLGMDVHL